MPNILPIRPSMSTTTPVRNLLHHARRSQMKELRDHTEGGDKEEEEDKSKNGSAPVGRAEVVEGLGMPSLAKLHLPPRPRHTLPYSLLHCSGFRVQGTCVWVLGARKRARERERERERARERPQRRRWQSGKHAARPRMTRATSRTSLRGSQQPRCCPSRSSPIRALPPVACACPKTPPANMAHIRQSMPDSGLGFQVRVAGFGCEGRVCQLAHVAITPPIATHYFHPLSPRR